MTDFFRELPFDPDDDDSHVEAAAVIIEAMGMDLDSADLVALLRLTRHAHRMALSDFKRRNDPAWRVPRARPRGRRLYDYGKDTGAGLEDWPAWWASIWARPRANPGRFRGTRIAKQPLVAVYHLCNRWWRRTTGEAFWPNFKHQISYRTDSERMPHLNDAARLFLLVAQDCDCNYNCDLCSRVHDVAYRDLDCTIP